MSGPKLIRAAEWARRVGVTRRTVLGWIQDGRVPGAARDEKGRWLVPEDAKRPVDRRVKSAELRLDIAETAARLGFTVEWNRSGGVTLQGPGGRIEFERKAEARTWLAGYLAGIRA